MCIQESSSIINWTNYQRADPPGMSTLLSAGHAEKIDLIKFHVHELYFIAKHRRLLGPMH